MRAPLAAVLVAALAAACSRPRRGDFRGSSIPSSDGKTYLVVDTTEGARCALLLDGKPWLEPSRGRAPVLPGPHTLACPGDGPSMRFVAHEGATYTLETWGP